MRHGYEVFHHDITQIVDFYLDVLGFTLDPATDRRDLTADTDYCVVTRDQLRVGCSRHPDAPAADRKPPHGSEIVLRVTDVYAELDRVETAHWPIEDPLQDRPWGQTDFRIFDPTGQYIRITN